MNSKSVSVFAVLVLLASIPPSGTNESISYSPYRLDRFGRFGFRFGWCRPLFAHNCSEVLVCQRNLVFSAAPARLDCSWTSVAALYRW